MRKMFLVLVLLAVMVCFIGLAFATNGEPGEEVKLGQYALPAILMVILGVIYKMAEGIPDRWKPLIAMGVGVGLGLVALEYGKVAWTFTNAVDYILYGFMAGASAVGLYEMSRAVIKPRS